MLARCVRLPGRVNPIKSLKKMLPLRDYVLNVMREEGWITEGQYEEGVQEVPNVVSRARAGAGLSPTERGPTSCGTSSRSSTRTFPGIDLANGGYTIQTTLNLKLQEKGGPPR